MACIGSGWIARIDLRDRLFHRIPVERRCPISSFPSPLSAEQIGAHLETMKSAQLQAGPPSIELRKDRIERAIAMLSTHRDALVDAIRSDYGSRGRQQTQLADILTPIEGLRFRGDRDGDRSVRTDEQGHGVAPTRGRI
ncbi:hypothetical protein [Paraburkholderia fungorum]|uniref:hypothetical protein n=1 Tax=Paraburkholderia fungorum TaxID=134537 RepID=UPI0038B823A6